MPVTLESTPPSEWLLNGEPGAALPALDRGLLYGDGLFETIAVQAGRARLWDRHMRRLQAGCQRLGLPEPDVAVLAAEAGRLIAGRSRVVLKIILTRGPGGRGYRGPQPPCPSRILALHPWPDYPPEWWERGIAARFCQTRLGCNPALAGIKHLNRLEQVLARAEWDDPGIAEGLMLDGEGRVIEGVMTNLFIVRGRGLLTPDLGRCGVAGVMRGWILDHAPGLGMTVRATDLGMDEINMADELFVTNSLVGVWPLRRLDGQRWAVGPATREIQQAVAAC